jgi:hypothetical protein
MTIAMPDHAAAMPAAPVCSAPMISIAAAAALGWFPPDWLRKADQRRAEKEARKAARRAA